MEPLWRAGASSEAVPLLAAPLHSVAFDRVTVLLGSLTFSQLARAATEALAINARKGLVVAPHLLDPTLDVVFKLLLLRNRDLLQDRIESVVSLPAPIEGLEIVRRSERAIQANCRY